MQNTIVVYDQKIEVYVHFVHKDKLAEIPYGKEFNWRQKCWVYKQYKQIGLPQILEAIRKTFPQFPVLQGQQLQNQNRKRLIKLNGDMILFYCNPIEDEQAKTVIASSKWDRKNDCWTYAASIDNLWLLKNSFPGVELSQDEHTRNIYQNLIKEKKEFEKETQELIKVKENGELITDYEYPHPPFEYQKTMVSFLVKTATGALLCDCGVGKSYAIINEINYRIQKGQIDSALIVCPISLMKAAFEADILKFKINKSYSILWIPTPGKKRKEYVESELAKRKQIYIINFEGAKIYEEQLTKFNFQYVTIDESSKIKSKKTNSFEAVLNISRNSKYRHISTATLAPNTPLESYSQFYFLDRGKTLGNNYKDFEQKFYDKIKIKDGNGAYVFTKPVLKPRSLEMLYEMIDKRSLRLKSEDCLTLPPQVFIDRKVQMTKIQEKYYNDMKENLFIEMSNGEIIETANAMSCLMKLRQITSGFVLNTASEEPERLLMDFDDNPKVQMYDSLIDEICGSGRKVVVWDQFRMSIEMLTERHKQYRAVSYYGATSANEKLNAIDKFTNDPDCKILISHPLSLGYGVTLTQASYMIFFALDFSQENFYQATKRIHRYSQNQKTFYYTLTCPGTVDVLMQQAIAKKTRIQDLLIDGKISRESIERLSEQTELSL